MLKNVSGRVVCKVDLQYKNHHTFKDGTKIRLERQYNNFNRRETEPTNAIVVCADNIPSGVEILVHHNALHETNRIYGYKPFSGKSISEDVEYFSIPENDCYAWRKKEGELRPMKDYAFALRVFRPYTGQLIGIAPTIIKEVLYITTGRLKGLVCHCVKAADYEIVFQGTNGREDRVIRLRHSDEEELEREEIVAVNHELTEQVSIGQLLIGLSSDDAKPFLEPQNTTNETANISHTFSHV